MHDGVYIITLMGLTKHPYDPLIKFHQNDIYLVNRYVIYTCHK